MAAPVDPDEHPPERVAAAMRALADLVMDQYPGVIAEPHVPGRRLPPGARTLPAVSPQDVGALRRRRAARPT